MKHADLISLMTLEEKAALLSGAGEWESRKVSRLGLPSFIMSDGPHGLRRQAGAGDHLGLNESLPATCFPTAATVANSWDPELGEAVGAALGEEAVEMGVGVLLGPGLNIKRSPLCGRNFEYFSEDPYLAGKMAAGYIRGIQSNGIYACPKHFAVNSQELRRMAMDAVLDERTLREIYLTGFEIAVQEGQAHTIMSAYNQVNGVYANENKHLLKDILRDEWGFDGIVISDWGASNSHTEGVRNGSDLEMPGCGFDSTEEICKAVREGTLKEEDLDERVDCMLDAMLVLGRKAKEVAEAKAERDKNNQYISAAALLAANTLKVEGAEAVKADGTSAEPVMIDRKEQEGFAGLDSEDNDGHRVIFDRKGHHALAKRAAAESAVLLKNEDKILPLKKGSKVAIIGDFAFDPRYQGAGSSLVNTTKVDSIISLINDYREDFEVIGMRRGYARVGDVDEALRKEALDIAAKADVVLYFFGLNEVSESEGGDRTHMRIPQNQIELLEEIDKVNDNIVGILSAGAPVEMPWQYCLRAILHGYLWGQAGAGAILDILTGKTNPSGRLNETYPLRYEDTPAFRNYPSEQRISEYRESVFVGYRYYLTSMVRTQYPFGFGLSYTDFEYSDLKVTREGLSCKITNIGDMDGAEVAQMYICMENPRIFRPVRELKGFQKVWLKAGETKEVFIPFDDKSFRYWNVATNSWEVESGTYQVMVGASCLDIRLCTEFVVEGTKAPKPYDKKKLADYYSGMIQRVPRNEFEILLGKDVPDGKWSGDVQPNDAFCQLYYSKSWIGRKVYKVLNKKLKKSQEKGIPDLNVMFIYNMPFRAMAKMTAGMVNTKMTDGIVEVFNGHFFGGVGKIISGFFGNRRLNKKYAKKIK